MAGVIFRQDLRGVPVQVLGETARHRLQIERPVGDVEEQQAARNQALPVDVGGFGGEQMHRDCVTRERVHYDQIEPTGLFALHLDARIAQHDLGFGFRIGQEREPGGGDRFDQRIDFVEADEVAGTAPGGHGSRSPGR